jgi:hypothetical protein
MTFVNLVRQRIKLVNLFFFCAYLFCFGWFLLLILSSPSSSFSSAV